MSANRTYGDELADVFASFAVEKNPIGLSVGIDSAYELGDHIESDWLTEHDRQVAERAWDVAVEETHALGWLHDFAKSDALARNPHRAAKGEQK